MTPENRKGTEPHWLCCECGRNTYGESSTSEGGKRHCDDCWFAKQAKEWQKAEKKKEQENIKIVSKVLGGDIKKATLIIKSINLT